jgi:hypothetical protein
MFALVTLLPLLLATAVPTRRDGTALYKIHPSGNSTLCLGTSWASNGRPVFVVDCDEYFPGYQNAWSVEKGDNLGVRVGYVGSVFPFCLDAGSTPENNGLVHMWACYPGLQQQQCVSCCPRFVRPGLSAHARAAGTTPTTSIWRLPEATSASTREATLVRLKYRHTRCESCSSLLWSC